MAVHQVVGGPAAFPPAALTRLREIENRRDPRNVLRGDVPVHA